MVIRTPPPFFLTTVRGRSVFSLYKLSAGGEAVGVCCDCLSLSGPLAWNLCK